MKLKKRDGFVLQEQLSALRQRIEYLHNVELFATLRDEEKEELARLERELNETIAPR